MSRLGDQILVVVSACLTYALVFFYRNITAVLYPQLAEALGVDEDKISILGSMYFWTYAFMQPIAGLLADVVSPSKLIAISTIISATGSIITALSRNFALTCFARLLVGIGCGPIFVPSSRLLSSWFSPKTFALLGGILLAAGSTGGLLAQGPLASLVEIIPWHYAFYIASGLGLIMAVICFFFVKPSPTPSLPDENPFWISLKVKALQLLKNAKYVVSHRVYWFQVLWHLLSPATFFDASSYWAAPYMKDGLGITKSTADYLIIALSLSWVIGSPVISFFSNVFKTRKYTTLFMNAIGIIFSIGFCFVNPGINNALLFFMLFMFGAGSGAVITISNAILKELFPPEYTGTSIGIANFFPFFLTGVLQIVQPYIFSAVDKLPDQKQHDLYTYKVALWAPDAVMIAIAFTSACFVTETYPHTPDNFLDSIIEEGAVSDHDVSTPLLPST